MGSNQAGPGGGRAVAGGPAGGLAARAGSTSHPNAMARHSPWWIGKWWPQLSFTAWGAGAPHSLTSGDSAGAQHPLLPACSDHCRHDHSFQDPNLLLSLEAPGSLRLALAAQTDKGQEARGVVLLSSGPLGLLHACPALPGLNPPRRWRLQRCRQPSRLPCCQTHPASRASLTARPPRQAACRWVPNWRHG